MSNPWYPWFPGDYKRDTSNLTLTQHGAYRLLLDHYYSNGKPLPCLEQCLRIACAMLPEEQRSVEFVLENFFTKSSDGTFSNKKAEKVIVEQDKKRTAAKEKAANAAKARWNKNAPSMPEALPEGVLEQCQPELDPELDLKPPPNPKPCSLKKEPKTSCDDPTDDHENVFTCDPEINPNMQKAFNVAMTLGFGILKNNPDNRSFREEKKRPTTAALWADDIEKLNRIDNYSWKQIEYCVEWSQQERFYKTIILSGSNLRKHFDAMVVKIKAEKEAPKSDKSSNWGAEHELN